MTGFDAPWAALAPIGRTPAGGYRRFAWTAADATLRSWFIGESETRGLDVTLDRAGNLWAWWGDPDTEGPGVVLGSHLDSVPDGGAFDGPLGVVSALLAVDALRATGRRPARPIGVVCFADEEGARFGVPCAGSRLLTGALAPERALALRDVDGTTLAEALVAAGRPPQELGADPDAVRRVGAFVELHVEQGRGLAGLDRAVGVGSMIRPHGRWRLDLRGRADHAGTTLIADRDDPMLALAAVITTARSAAARSSAAGSSAAGSSAAGSSAAGPGLVATVGRVRIEPNAVNAIPGLVQAWLDARGDSEDAVRALAAEVAAAGGTRAVEESFTAATPFDPALTARASRLLGDAPVLPTGAGHDAGILARAGIPTTMLFVRNPTGVSHSPAEHAERDDCLAGVEALAAVAADLAATPSGAAR